MGKLKGGTAGILFRIALLVLLAVIACLLYQSWAALSTFHLFTDVGNVGNGQGLGDFISQLNDFFKKVIDLFTK
jgi:hypothetical protein